MCVEPRIFWVAAFFDSYQLGIASEKCLITSFIIPYCSTKKRQGNGVCGDKSEDEKNDAE